MLKVTVASNLYMERHERQVIDGAVKPGMVFKGSFSYYHGKLEKNNGQYDYVLQPEAKIIFNQGGDYAWDKITCKGKPIAFNKAI